MPRKKKSDIAAAPTDVETQEAVVTESAPEAPAPARRRAPRKEVDETIIIQYGGSEWNLAELKERAIAEFVAEGHRRGNISKLALYVKPEDRKVYFVVNDKMAGCADFECE